MANAQKVANIFEMASLAFGRLAELTLDLKVFQAQSEHTPSTNSRWTIAEIELLKDAVSRFGNDLAKISEVLDRKTVSQIKHKIKEKAFAESGLDEAQEAEVDDLDDLPRVSTISVDRSRRKQTFSDRGEDAAHVNKKRKIEDVSSQQSTQSITSQPRGMFKPHSSVNSNRNIAPRSSTVLSSTLTDYEYMQGAPRDNISLTERPDRIPNASLSVPPIKRTTKSESKYEEYSDSGSEHYEEPDDDDDDEDSDEGRYYSEDEGDH